MWLPLQYKQDKREKLWGCFSIVARERAPGTEPYLCGSFYVMNHKTCEGAGPDAGAAAVRRSHGTIKFDLEV
jgi:hypothetical protein